MIAAAVHAIPVDDKIDKRRGSDVQSQLQVAMK